jgi:hypothetical protein
MFVDEVRFMLSGSLKLTATRRYLRRQPMKRGAILLTLVGIALPLSASAQDAQFSVYGTLMPFVDNWHTT